MQCTATTTTEASRQRGCSIWWWWCQMFVVKASSCPFVPFYHPRKSIVKHLQVFESFHWEAHNPNWKKEILRACSGVPIRYSSLCFKIAEHRFASTPNSILTGLTTTLNSGCFSPRWSWHNRCPVKQQQQPNRASPAQQQQTASFCHLFVFNQWFYSTSSSWS